MKNILITGFIGNKNSSKILLDNLIKNINMDYLYLENDFEISEKQLKDKLKHNKYDIIFAFGQKPVIKSIYIEKTAKNGNKNLETKYNYIKLKHFLDNYIKNKISENAGNYLCNNIYYKGLEYIKIKKLETEMIFIHVPYVKNMDIKYLCKIFNIYMKNILGNNI